ncbi:MAG: A24 family peptidase [Alphaproteobacteria bacterium]
MTLETYIHFAVVGIFLTLLAFAALGDIATYKIPNRITLAIAALYPVYVLASPVTVDWLSGLMVGGVVLGVGFTLFAFKVFGGGDIKMMAATSLWAGPVLIADFLIITALAGGLISLFWISPLRPGLALAVDRFNGQVKSSTLSATMIPYGLAVAVGGVGVAINLLGFGRGI